MWPFGPRNNYPYTDFHELNLDWILNKVCQLGENVKELYKKMEQFFIDTIPIISETVNEWLDNHPEATSTVEDHSLTYIKLVNGTLGFVTPEMFGAVGDSTTDDTQAWQDALDYGGKILCNKNKSYRGIKN